MKNKSTFSKTLIYSLLTLITLCQSIKSMIYCKNAKVIILIIVHTGSTTPKKMLHYCLFKNDQTGISIPVFNYNPQAQPESPSSKGFVQVNEDLEKEKLDSFVRDFFSTIDIEPRSFFQRASIVEDKTQDFLYRYEIEVLIDSTNFEAVKENLSKKQYELIEVKSIKSHSLLLNNPIINSYCRDKSTVFFQLINEVSEII